VAIPLAEPNLSDDDRRAFASALQPREVAYGPTVTEFEQAVAMRVDAEHAVASSNGTAALHLALIESGVAPNDDVLMPTLTYVAPANAVCYVGANPVFIDVDPDYGQLDVERAAAYLESHYRPSPGGPIHSRTGHRAAAVLAVDLLGHPCDLDAIMELADRFGLRCIDDAAEAFGATLRGRPLGSIAPVSVLSFNANKIITTAGGGMLLCDDGDAARHARSLAAHAKQAGSTRYRHTEIGFNYLMASPQAALGLSQLARMDEFVARKRAIALAYDRALRGLSSVRTPTAASWASPTFWLYTIHVPAGVRDRLMSALDECGIETRPMFEPMHLIPAHRGREADHCPVAEWLAKTGLCLPCSTRLKDGELADVVAALGSALEALA
jgi:perosamine synthetase